MMKLLSLACWRRLAQGGFLALALLATGGAWAQICNVTVSAMLPGNQAVLKADCGSTQMQSVTWTSDAGGASLIPPLVPVVYGPFTFPPTTADLFFTTTLAAGTHSYTASGLDSTGAAVTSGKAAVITLIQPALTVTATAGGTVSSNPAGISCTNAGGANCVHNYDPSTTVILTAAATTGNVFSGWSGDCSGAAATCSVSMTTARNVTATFAPIPTFSVTGQASPSAGGSVSCTSPVNQNATSTCGITTNSGYTLTGASSNTCGGSLSGSNFTTGAVTSNCIVTATFSVAPTNYTVGTNVTGSGTLVCTPNPVNAGTSTNCVATATSGATFTGFSGSSCSLGTPAGNQVIAGPINSACQVTANFTAAQQTQSFTVSGQTNPAGVATVTCNPSTVTQGGTSSCTISGITAGYTLTSASATCGGTLSGSNFNTGAVNSNCTVTAFFSTGSTAPANCGVNEVFNLYGGDQDWNPLTTTQVWPRTPVNATGDLGLAVRFVADSATYPTGLVMQLIDQSPQLLGKDAVVSACPHNFTPVNGQAYCSKSNVSNTASIYLRFGAATTWYDCSLTPGVSYFLNFRDHATPRGTVSTQFSNMTR